MRYVVNFVRWVILTPIIGVWIVVLVLWFIAYCLETGLAKIKDIELPDWLWPS